MNRGLSWGLGAGAVMEGHAATPGCWGRRQIWQLCRSPLCTPEPKEGPSPGGLELGAARTGRRTQEHLALVRPCRRPEVAAASSRRKTSGRGFGWCADVCSWRGHPQDEDWGLPGVRASGGSRQRGPAAPREGLSRRCLVTPMGRTASLQKRPQPLCFSPGRAARVGRGGGRRPGRASTGLFSPVGSGPGPDLVPLRLSLAVPTSLFNKEATAWFRGRRKTRPG